MGVVTSTLFLGILLVFTQSARFQRWDEEARFCTGSSGRSWAVMVDPLIYLTEAALVLGLVFFVGVAVVRRRFALALAPIVLVAGANTTTQVLKTWLPTHPHLWANSLPSGHSTAAMSISLAVVLVAPAVWRRGVGAVAACLSTFVGAGTVVGHWHRPGDVIAAFLGCGLWAVLAIALVRKVQRGRGSRAARYSARPRLVVVVASLAGLVLILLGVRPLHHDVDWFAAGLTFSSIWLLSVLIVSWVAAATEDNIG